jgi:ABC-2 type transport system permease protein
MVMILTLGFLFGGLFNNMEIASGILSFSMVPLLMLSGAMLPLYILPDVIQYVSYIIPFTYLSDLYHQTLYGLNGKVPPMINILLLFVLSALFFYFTKKSFRWK